MAEVVGPAWEAEVVGQVWEAGIHAPVNNPAPLQSIVLRQDPVALPHRGLRSEEADDPRPAQAYGPALSGPAPELDPEMELDQGEVIVQTLVTALVAVIDQTSVTGRTSGIAQTSAIDPIARRILAAVIAQELGIDRFDPIALGMETDPEIQIVRIFPVAVIAQIYPIDLAMVIDRALVTDRALVIGQATVTDRATATGPEMEIVRCFPTDRATAIDLAMVIGPFFPIGPRVDSIAPTDPDLATTVPIDRTGGTVGKSVTITR